MNQQPETFFVIEFTLDHEYGGGILFMARDSHGCSRTTPIMMKAETFPSLVAAQRLVGCYHSPFGPQGSNQSIFAITASRLQGAGTFTVVKVDGSSWSDLKSAPVWQQHVTVDYSSMPLPTFTFESTHL